MNIIVQKRQCYQLYLIFRYLRLETLLVWLKYDQATSKSRNPLDLLLLFVISALPMLTQITSFLVFNYLLS